ncbi:penicillin acylase family protein [bacterium]|nr:penicillin acylase family protein [bacterium]
MMKFLRRLVWGGVIALVLLVVASKVMSYYWGRDLEQLEFQDARYEFSAKRVGDSAAFQIEAKDETQLWFAMGYLQGWDREFQTELIRLASTGRLSSMLGASMLSNDQLMRFNYRAAEKVWHSLAVDSVARRAAQAFADGRNAVLRHEEKSLPIEYKIMGIFRDDLSSWTGIDVLAIARFHGWSLSYDQNMEKTYMALKTQLGVEKSKWLQPPSDLSAVALYEQKLLNISKSGGLLKPVAKQKPTLGYVPIPKKALPYKLDASGMIPELDFSPVESDMEHPEEAVSVWNRLENYATSWGAESAFQGASNMWVLANPRVGRALSLCNDTHLRLTWPSPLYPISYRIKDRVKGQGFMMPGTPAVVIGYVQNLNEEAKFQKLLWGITSGSLADTQDLIEIKGKDTENLKVTVEEFSVRNMKTGEVEPKNIEAIWSEHGPIVNNIFSDFSKLAAYKSPVALDSPIFKTTPSTMEFFVLRNLGLGENLEEDLVEKIQYPPINFTWISEEKGQKLQVGHMLTGVLYGRPKRRDNGLETLDSRFLKRDRYLSYPSERPYFKQAYGGEDPFMLVTANQSIWSDKGSEQKINRELAYLWAPDKRAERIAEKFDDNTRELGYSQHDFYSPRLNRFFVKARKMASAGRLCSGTVMPHSDCMKMLSEIDAWDGDANAEDFRTSLIVLWHARFKWKIIEKLTPAEVLQDEVRGPAIKEMMIAWGRRTFTHHLVEEVIEDPKARAQWESWTGKSVEETLSESFSQSVNELSEGFGPLYQYWKWGNLHRVSWLHPLVRAPEPIGSMFHEGVLLRPQVSGALDSSGRFEYDWDPEKPLDFPATHGGASRLCMEWSEKEVQVNWSLPSGPSGNPFSNYSKPWALETYFKNKLSRSPQF